MRFSISTNKKLFKSILIGTLCSVAAITVLMLLCALILQMAGLYPADILDYITLAFLAIGCIIGGFIASRLNKHAGLVTGVITGLCVFLIIIIIGITGASVSMNVVYKLLATIIGGAIGGILGNK